MPTMPNSYWDKSWAIVKTRHRGVHLGPGIVHFCMTMVLVRLLRAPFAKGQNGFYLLC